MSEELLQRDLINNPEKLGKWNFYNIGATTLRSLKQNKIIPNIKYNKFENRKPDGLITDSAKVIALISNKLPKNLKTKKQVDKEISDWADITKILKSRLLIVTDTKKTIWINALTKEPIRDENGNQLQNIFDPKSIESVKLIEKILSSINDSNSQLFSPKFKDPSPLAKQIWQDIWSVAGATPENCLYTFIELFIFKYLSDLNVLTGFYNFYDLMKKYDSNTDEQVLEFYAETIRKEIKNKFKENPKDKTTIINGTIFVSKDDKAVEGYSSVFRKVLEKFEKEGKLENIHHDFKSKLFETFLKESISKKNWGQFFTPLKVVRAIVSMVDIKEGMKICDPACGVGKFLLEPILKDLSRFYRVDKNRKLKRYITLVGYDKGFDRDEQKTIILAKANMLIYLSDLIRDNPDITDQFSDLFNDTFILKTNSILGTLSEPVKDEYDLILTNPPYVTSGSSNIKEEIVKSGLEDHFAINAMGVEGLFAEWIIRALKPGGKAFVVVPDGILTRTNDKNLRKFILDECCIDAIISLPEKTFFTTIKKTYILAITKKIRREDVQKDPVFTYLVSEIGETLDVYRFDTDINQLEDSVILFRQFVVTKNRFKSNDKRCKILPIERFIPEDHWAVERWWSEKEKIELGIIEKENKMSIADFSGYVGQIAETLVEYQVSLKELSGKKANARKYKEVRLGEESCFELFIGKRVVKRDLVKIEGDIPVFSANVFASVGFLKESNIKNFDNEFILWGIDGDFEFSYMKRGMIFATTDHCGAIRIKDDRILPSYLLYQLNLVKKHYGYDRALRASLNNMQSVIVRIPITEDGCFDTEAQREIAEDHTVIKDISDKMHSYKVKISSTEIDINLDNYVFGNVLIGELFDLPPIKGLKAKFIRAHNGTIPVYGGKMEGQPIGYVKNDLKGVKYFENCLGWNREGSVGYVFLHEHKFTTNDHHRPLELKPEFISFVDMRYMKYEIQRVLLLQGFEWSKTASKAKVGKISIRIPIMGNGQYDISAQKEIVEKYRILENTQTELGKKLGEFSNIKVELN